MQRCANLLQELKRINRCSGWSGQVVLATMGPSRKASQDLQVQVNDLSTPPSSYRRFMAYGGYDEPYAPALDSVLKTWL